MYIIESSICRCKCKTSVQMCDPHGILYKGHFSYIIEYYQDNPESSSYQRVFVPEGLYFEFFEKSDLLNCWSNKLLE